MMKVPTHVLRDPMSKTLVVALVGIICLTIITLSVVGGAIWKGNIGDGAIIGLISTLVTGIGGCVGVVASRAQSPHDSEKVAVPLPEESAAVTPKADSL